MSLHGNRTRLDDLVCRKFVTQLIATTTTTTTSINERETYELHGNDDDWSKRNTQIQRKKK